jgi:hypothetical protein
MHTAREILEQLKELKDEKINEQPRLGEADEKNLEEKPIRDSLLDRSKTGIPELSLSQYLDPDSSEEEEENPLRCGSTEKGAKS